MSVQGRLEHEAPIQYLSDTDILLAYWNRSDGRETQVPSRTTTPTQPHSLYEAAYQIFVAPAAAANPTNTRQHSTSPSSGGEESSNPYQQEDTHASMPQPPQPQQQQLRRTIVLPPELLDPTQGRLHRALAKWPLLTVSQLVQHYGAPPSPQQQAEEQDQEETKEEENETGTAPTAPTETASSSSVWSRSNVQSYILQGLLSCPQCSRRTNTSTTTDSHRSSSSSFSSSSSSNSQPHRLALLYLLHRACPALRDDATTMLAVMQTMVWSTQDMGPSWLGPRLQHDATFGKLLMETALYVPATILRCFATKIRCHSLPVVLAACHRNGETLLHTGSGLRRHAKVVQVASRQEPTAVRHALSGSSTERLRRDGLFWRTVLQRVSTKASAVPSIQTLLQHLHPSLLQPPPSHNHPQNSNHINNNHHNHHHTNHNWDICLLVARAGWQALPRAWYSNATFWKQAIVQSHLSLSDLPPPFQLIVVHPTTTTTNNDNDDNEWGTSSSHHRKRRTPKRNAHHQTNTNTNSTPTNQPDDRVRADVLLTCLYQAALDCAYLVDPQDVLELFRQFPHLLHTDSERAIFPLFWYTKARQRPTAANGNGETVSSRTMDDPEALSSSSSSSSLLQQIPSTVWSNQAVMMQALSLYPQSTLEWIHVDLLTHHPELIQTALDVYGARTLEYLPPHVQRTHVELVVQAVYCLGDGNHNGRSSQPSPGQDENEIGATGRQDPSNSTRNDREARAGPAVLQDVTFSSFTPSTSSSGAALPRPSLWSVYNWILPELWHDARLAIAWVSVGGNFLHDDFSPHFDSNAELFLAMAKAQEPQLRLQQYERQQELLLQQLNLPQSPSLQANPPMIHDRPLPPRQGNTLWCGDVVFASEALLGDRSFLEQAIRYNGHVLWEGRNGLNRDLDLATLAVASTPTLLDGYDWNCLYSSTGGTTPFLSSSFLDDEAGSHGEAPEGDYEFCLALSHHVHQRLSVYHAFMEFVLGIAFSERRRQVQEEENRGNELFTVAASSKADDTRGNVGQPQESCCVLGMLRVGKETTQALQHLIALYVGIPMGDDLQTLCRASDHLAAYGFSNER